MMTKKGKHTVLFICLGNICRSPAGEGIMKATISTVTPDSSRNQTSRNLKPSW